MTEDGYIILRYPWSRLFSIFISTFRFLGTTNHQNIYVQVLTDVVKASPDLEHAECKGGHNIIGTLLPKVGRSLFNAFASNLCRDVNSHLHAKLPSKRLTDGDREDARKCRDAMKRQKLQGWKP